MRQKQGDTQLVESRWRDTYPLRQLELGKNKLKCIEDWPNFKDPNGYEFVDMDFYENHRENNNGLIENYKAIFDIALIKSFEKSGNKLICFDPMKERSISKF